MAVMAKASTAGRCKTRLVPPLTLPEAAAFNTAFLQDIHANLTAASRHASVAAYMAFAPAGSEAFFREAVSRQVGLIETVADNLGDCLFHAVSTLLRSGYGSACLLNSDSPTLPAAYLVTAATLLAVPGDRMVIGPSTDGGYYLIGLKTPLRRLFDDIAWSTEHVFRQTLERADEIGIETVVLPDWYDVDDRQSLRTLVTELIDGRPFRHVGSEASPATHTRRLLRGLLETTDLDRRLDLGQPQAVAG